MTNGKMKGKAGELEWAKLLTAAGFPARRGKQYSGDEGSPDVICPVLDVHLHCEVKRRERLDIGEALAQAAADSGGLRPSYVAHRKNRGEWLVTMTADSFLVLMQRLIL